MLDIVWAEFTSFKIFFVVGVLYAECWLLFTVGEDSRENPFESLFFYKICY
jgi:hypothetical protein